MGLKYDQRTLNKVLKQIKERKSNLEKTKAEFKKQGKDYLFQDDKQNYARMARLVECITFTIDEFDNYTHELKEVFSGNTNSKKKLISSK